MGCVQARRFRGLAGTEGTTARHLGGRSGRVDSSATAQVASFPPFQFSSARNPEILAGALIPENLELVRKSDDSRKAANWISAPVAHGHQPLSGVTSRSTTTASRNKV